ncbi:hypothetical protein F5880DRAFT_1506971 [Lentinula raphanica]|nr:hypothetical protein F5880DRAFT_1506971 [Lentinula raphanica]
MHATRFLLLFLPFILMSQSVSSPLGRKKGASKAGSRENTAVEHVSIKTVLHRLIPSSENPNDPGAGTWLSLENTAQPDLAPEHVRSDESWVLEFQFDKARFPDCRQYYYHTQSYASIGMWGPGEVYSHLWNVFVLSDLLVQLKNNRLAIGLGDGSVDQIDGIIGNYDRYKEVLWSMRSSGMWFRVDKYHRITGTTTR